MKDPNAIENAIKQGLKILYHPTVKSRYLSVSLVPYKSDFVVLDDGCGYGVEIFLLKKQFGYIIGVDLSLNHLIAARRILEILKETQENVDFVLADGASLPFIGNSFDMVTSSYVLEHIEKRDTALKEMRRALKDGHAAVISLDTHMRYIYRLLRTYKSRISFLVSKPRAAVCSFQKYLKHFFEKELKPTLTKTSTNEIALQNTKKRIARIVATFVFPIHGEYDWPTQEFFADLPTSWLSLIKRSGLKVKRVLGVNFPFSTKVFNRYPLNVWLSMGIVVEVLK